MTTREIDGTTLELTTGDITQQSDVDAVVNAANARLESGGGVAGAIHRAAGPGLVQECRPLAPIQPGQAVITSGHNLPNGWIVHTLGPVYGHDDPSDDLLASCYRESLRVASDKGATSIAFPAISTGAFGYPMKEAAQVALSTVRREAANHPPIARIRFVLASDRDLKTHEQALHTVNT